MTSAALLVLIVKIIASAGILLYIILIGFFFFGWISQKPFIAFHEIPNVFVCIIISARNEEKNLPHLLQSLERQNYPENKFEIILVDDHSTDSTLKIMQQFSETRNNARYISLPAGKTGKKSAIRFAINLSVAELIITTDADCRMNPDWLLTIVSFREKTKASLIIGPVAYLYNNSFFAKIQALEFASLIASGAASAFLRRPIMCNGANLAFIKSEYPIEENSLAVDSPSGDDIFLLQHLKKINRNNIKFLKSSESIVFTTPSANLPEFINQRKRWYSKSSLYTDYEILGSGFIVTYANFSLLLVFAICIISSVPWAFLLLLFMAKLSADMIFLYPFLGFIKSRKLLWLAPILEIFYPFYILYIMISCRVGRYIWKDRKY